MKITPYHECLLDLKKPKIKEGVIVNSCIRALFAIGCYVWRNNTGAYKPKDSGRFIKYGKKGSADIIGVMPGGKFIAVECKAGKNPQSQDQILFQQRIEEKGGVYILAHSADELLEALKA